jgi:hypothetical protein
MVPEGPLVLGNVLARTGPAYWTLPAEYCVLRAAYYVLRVLRTEHPWVAPCFGIAHMLPHLRLVWQ